MKPLIAAVLALAFAAGARAGDYEDGMRHLQRESYRDAAAAFERAARAGDARAERERAMMIYRGLGTARDDARAVALLERAAEAGDLVAQVNLASMYENGLSVARDEARSAHWWIAAANRGDARAQFRAGEVLWLGQGVARDRLEALKWWTLAREQGEEEWMRATIAGLREPPTEAAWEEGRRRAREWRSGGTAPRP